MGKHKNQVHHNADFLKHQCRHCSDRFFDWKVICCFYIAYHAVKGLAEHRKIDIGKSHSEISRNFNPQVRHAQMRLSQNCWRNYRDLRIHSESARYNGFENIQDHEDQNRENLRESVDMMNFVLKYCKGQGLEVEAIAEGETVGLIEE